MKRHPERAQCSNRMEPVPNSFGKRNEVEGLVIKAQYAIDEISIK